jgi:hypothetical protein
MLTAERGPLLTALAILFAALAVSNLLKPLTLGGDSTGFVFLGHRLGGFWNSLLGPLFGLFLATYAYGIFRMRRFALPMARAYALYVIVNLIAWNVVQDNPFEIGAAAGVLYFIVAVGVSSGAAVALSRRTADLS